MTASRSLPEILAEIRHKTREPFSWQQVKALQPLFWIRLASAAVYFFSVLGLLPFSYSAADQLLNAAAAVCLLLLTNAHNGYKAAFVSMVLALGFGLLPSVAGSATLAMVFSSLCVMLSNCLEYIAHSKLTMRQDRKLTARWNRLFFWNIAAMIAGGGVYMLVAVFYSIPEFASMELYLVMLAITYVPDILIDIVYLAYLIRTIHLIRSQKILF